MSAAWPNTPSQRRASSIARVTGQRGTVAIEVLLALVPLLFTFLGVTQLALFQVGKLVVTHAANRAARSAVVVLDDDPTYYDEAPRYDLVAGGASDDEGLAGFLGEVNDSYSELLQGGSVQGGARMVAIRQAAYHPLSVLTPSFATLGGTRNVAEEVGASPWTRIAFLSLGYNRAAASVRVESASGGGLDGLGPRDPITVRVDYLMTCGVPLVSRFMCRGGVDLARASLGVSTDETDRTIIERLSGVASPVMRDALLALGGRYLLISAEATLPNQGAGYH